MTLSKILLAMLAAISFAACSGTKSKTARDLGENAGQGGDHPSTKPTPAMGTVVEKVVALQFQKPTHDEAEYLNVLDLDFGSNDRAYYSFNYAPGEDGTFYFTMDQVRLLLRGCTKADARPYKMEVYWQRVQGNDRVVLKHFSPSIDDFQYQKGNTYILTYALVDLKKDFADCKGATLKFATFKKNY